MSLNSGKPLLKIDSKLGRMGMGVTVRTTLRTVLVAFALAVGFCMLDNTRILATGNLEVITQSQTRIGNRVWTSPFVPVIWHYNDPNTAVGCGYSSPTAPVEDLFAAVQASFNTWEAIPDATIAFSFGGTTSVRNVGFDRVNVVTFCSDTTFTEGVLATTPTFALAEDVTVSAGGGCPPGEGDLLGSDVSPASPTICFPVGSYPAGMLLDAEVDINTSGTQKELLTTGSDPGMFHVEDILAHQVGHFIGLSHDPIFGATMDTVIEDMPPSDGTGQRVLSATDISTAGRYYPGPGYGTNLGTITGIVTLDGSAAEGVHVVAIDPNTMMAVTGRFSLSQFEDPNALGPEGADIDPNVGGPGFYRIDGLPAGNYYVMVEYFDDSDTTGRLTSRFFNATVHNSSVARSDDPTNQAPAWEGFLPKLVEFYDTVAGGGADSGDGGDGLGPGTAVDNSDAATLVSVTAGSVTPNIDIAINIEPTNGQTAAEREDPTTRSTKGNAVLFPGDPLTAIQLNGGADDFYAILFPSTSLPTPPYNIAEALWTRVGLSSSPMETLLTFKDPNNPNTPNMNHPVVSSAGRAHAGGPNGATAAGDTVHIRDQWNVTINQARDVWFVLHQPDSPAGIDYITEGSFYQLICQDDPNGFCVGGRINNTLVTEDGGLSWALLVADVFYTLIMETTPPVMVTSASPSSLQEGQTANVIVSGVGFRLGATVDFGPDVTVNSVTFLDSMSLQVNITPNITGATASRDVNVTVKNPEVLFPNVARLFTIDPSIDTDGDGVADALDCAPTDSTLMNPATEVTGVTITDLGGSTQVAWDSQDSVNGTATSYDVVTGLVTELRLDGGYASAACAVNDNPDTPFIDTNVDPPPVVPGMCSGGICVAGGDVNIGDSCLIDDECTGPGAVARYWLVRAVNACNITPGTYGTGNGNIIPDPRSTLDSGIPCP